MRFNKVLIFTFLIFAASLGRTQEYKPVKGWKYIPKDEAFWEAFSALSTKGNSSDTMDFVLARISAKADLNTASGAEQYLAFADTLQSLTLPQASFHIYLQILKNHPGSAMAQKALVEMDKLLQTGNFDEAEVSRVINQAAFVEVPEGLENMLYFYTATDDMKKGLYRWAEKGTKKISESGYWGYRFRYLKALEQYRSDQLQVAEQELQTLAEQADMPASLMWRIQLQRARIFIERNEFEKAETTYTALDFPGRLFGRVLLERAWGKYYQRDFASALGLLESLKAPAFRIFSNPEQTILAMLIYREICYYPEVVRLSAEFRESYQRTYDLVKKGKPLTESPALMWMTLQKPVYRDVADVIDAIQKEQVTAKTVFKSYEKSPAVISVMKSYNSNEQELQGRVEYAMKEDLRKQADGFLASWDQVKLLEYISKLDEYRIKQVFEERSYEATKADTRSFDILYWPVSGEYWKEEFKSYRMILSDRCEAPGKRGTR